jgi:hypothetical protein
MVGINKVLVENLKILAKIFPVKKIQIYNNEASIVLHTNDFLDGLLFLKNNILYQFKKTNLVPLFGERKQKIKKRKKKNKNK